MFIQAVMCGLLVPSSNPLKPTLRDLLITRAQGPACSQSSRMNSITRLKDNTIGTPLA